jgi:hypothetical protein
LQFKLVKLQTVVGFHISTLFFISSAFGVAAAAASHAAFDHLHVELATAGAGFAAGLV